jgi:hypothetical protein
MRLQKTRRSEEGKEKGEVQVQAPVRPEGWGRHVRSPPAYDRTGTRTEPHRTPAMPKRHDKDKEGPEPPLARPSEPGSPPARQPALPADVGPPWGVRPVLPAPLSACSGAGLPFWASGPGR